MNFLVHMVSKKEQLSDQIWRFTQNFTIISVLAVTSICICTCDTNNRQLKNVLSSFLISLNKFIHKNVDHVAMVNLTKQKKTFPWCFAIFSL